MPSYRTRRIFAREILRIEPRRPDRVRHIGTLTRAKFRSVPSYRTKRIFAREIVRMGGVGARGQGGGARQ